MYLKDIIRGGAPMKKTIVFLSIIGTLLFLRFVVFFLASIPSGSMIPTIEIGDQILANRLDRNFHRGDVVIFPYPDDESTLYIKRIIGEPGDSIEIKDGKTYVNEEALEEVYLAEPQEGEYGPYTVPEGHYFMLGDNRNHSADARFWNNTYVEEEKIVGKAFWVWFPFNHLHAI